jgi:hypothetical protein
VPHRRVVDAKYVEEGFRQLELATLPTSKEWNYWWRVRERERRLGGIVFGWERALTDAVTRLVRNNLTLSRITRLEGEAKRVFQYDTDGHVYGEDSKSPLEFTREALIWFLQVVKPTAFDPVTGVRRPEMPEEFELIFKAVEGCYLQQARLGIELTGIKKRGYLTINHSATIPNPESIDPKTGIPEQTTFRETGMETL